jgi:hypothetical protein
VFLIRRRQADAPNHCSHPANIVLLHLHGCGVTAMPFAVILRILRHRKGLVVCHTACSSSSFVTAAFVSFASLHSSAPHFRSIPPVRGSSICFRHGLHSQHTNQHTCSHIPFRKPTLQHSLGSIPLRSSLLHFSHAQSTRCP